MQQKSPDSFLNPGFFFCQIRLLLKSFLGRLLSLSLFSVKSDLSLSRSQSSDRNTERRAGDIIQTDSIVEINRSRIAASFTAASALSAFGVVVWTRGKVTPVDDPRIEGLGAYAPPVDMDDAA